VLRRLAADPAVKNWSAERLEGLEELNRRYPQSESADKAFLDAFFAQAWREWQRALRELIENIEAPGSSQHDREESLRALPHVLEDIERALELYRKRHGGHEAPFDPQLLDRAKDLLQRTPALESRLEPKQRDDADLLSWEGGGRGRASQNETDTLMPASYSFHDGPARPQHDRAPDQFERVMDLLEITCGAPTRSGSFGGEGARRPSGRAAIGWQPQCRRRSFARVPNGRLHVSVRCDERHFGSHTTRSALRAVDIGVSPLDAFW
jgi:hypothetical protein